MKLFLIVFRKGCLLLSQLKQIQWIFEIIFFQKAGDFFSVNGELKIATADANSDGSGNVTLSFAPRLRTSPSDGASVETTAPSGTFLLMDSRQGWNYRPGKFSDFTLKFVEDIAA